MINFEDVIQENIKYHNLNWLPIPDHPFKILIIGRLWVRKNKCIT